MSTLSISLATETDLSAVMELVARCIEDMRRRGIDQWDDVYPSLQRLALDVAAGTLHLARSGEDELVFVLDRTQDPEYADVPWTMTEEPVAVVHRLMVEPRFQGRGHAKQLMELAEQRAAEQGYAGMRLDAFTLNPGALRLYRGLGYREAGEVSFRKGRFKCFEKRLDHMRYL